MKPVLVACWRDSEENLTRALASCARHVSGVAISCDPAFPADAIIVQELARGMGLPAHVYFTTRTGAGGPLRTTVMEEGEQFAASIGAKYLLMLDSDDLLEFERGFEWPTMEDAAYLVDAREPSIVDGREVKATHWPFKRIFKVGLGWRWRGAIHERPLCDSVSATADARLLPGVHYLKAPNKRGPDYYLKHAEICREWLREHPGDSEYVFWLAMSLRDACAWAAARAAFEDYLTAADGEAGWRYVAAMASAQCAMEGAGGAPALDIGLMLLRASEIAPERAEPWAALAKVAEFARSQLPLPKGAMMLDRSAYGMTTARSSV